MIRPHLQVRMPSFDYTDEEWNDLISYFQQKDNLDLKRYDVEKKTWIREQPSFNNAYLAYLGTINVDLNKGNGFIYLYASHESPIFAKKLLIAS